MASEETRADGTPTDDDLSAIRAALGREVRRRRLAAGLNGRQLAEQAGITPGFVSQMEKGQAMPSVATLLAISSALDVSIGELFEASQSAERIVRADARPAYQFPDLGFVDEHVSADPKGRLQVLVSRIAPGGGSGPELYTHGAETEFILVLRGRLELYLDDTTHVLEQGDAATFSGDTAHGYANVDDEEVEVIWVMTPATY